MCTVCTLSQFSSVVSLLYCVFSCLSLSSVAFSIVRGLLLLVFFSIVNVFLYFQCFSLLVDIVFDILPLLDCE